jgi:hypothetical protein
MDCATGSDAGQLLTVESAARALEIDPKRMYQLASRTGFFPEGVVVRIGRSVRVSSARLQDWIAAGGSSCADCVPGIGRGA